MKKLFLTITTLAIIGLSNLVDAQAPNWAWAKSAGGSVDDEGKSVATDASGNVYVTGYFKSPTLTFGTTTLTSAGYYDMFIAKYDASGNVLWANNAGGNEDDQALSVATDANGNVFVTGNFQSPTISFGTIVLNNPNPPGSYDIFIVKYDASGNALWANSASGTFDDESYSVTCDASGNVFMAGYFNSPTITFGTTTLNNVGSDDIFLTKYDASGNVLWAKSTGSISDERAYSLATDASGNVFMTGIFRNNTINFGAIILTNSNPGWNDIFIVKYDTNGNVIWAKSAGGTYDDYGYSVATDAVGNVFLAGIFYCPTITFGNTTFTNAGGCDIYIVKYNASGNVLWANDAGGANNDLGLSVATDIYGNVFMTGFFSSTAITFGTTTFTIPFGSDVFIVKYDASGNVNWATSPNNTNGIGGNSISIDTFGNAYITGSFGGATVTFGSSTLTNAGNYDIFLAKLNGTTGIEELQEGSFTIAPNPFTSQTTITFSKEQKNTTIKIMDVLGKEIKDITFNGKQFILEKGAMREGLYFVQVQSKDNTETKKMIVAN